MDLRIAIVPVGRMDPVEVEAAAARIAKILNREVTLRQPAAVRRRGRSARGQHVAGPFLAELRGQLARLAVVKRVGAAPAEEPAGARGPRRASSTRPSS